MVACTLPSYLAVDHLTLCLVLASPHILYAFIWIWPSLWKQAFKQKSSDVLANVAVALKVAQGSACLLWLAKRRSGDMCLDLTNVDAWRLTAFAALFGVGQVLNVTTYHALGKAGVYYGSKLGHDIPWVSGFPFSVVPHPQYLGSVMSLWGIGAVFSSFDRHVWNVVLFWTALYCATALIEDFITQPSAAALAKKVDGPPLTVPPRESSNVVRMRI